MLEKNLIIREEWIQEKRKMNGNEVVVKAKAMLTIYKYIQQHLVGVERAFGLR